MADTEAVELKRKGNTAFKGSMLACWGQPVLKGNKTGTTKSSLCNQRYPDGLCALEHSG